MKNKIQFSLCSIILLILSLSARAGVPLPASKCMGDANSGALLGEYKALADKIITISFIIAAVPVLFHLAGNTPRAKKAVIGYLAAILIYYGVISKFI